MTAATPSLKFALAIAAIGLLASAAAASPQGAEWTVLDDAAGCASCHLGSPDPAGSSAIAIEGLPAKIAPGQRLRLQITLSDPALRTAGFLLEITSGDLPAGQLSSVDATTTADGSRARSTRAGSLPVTPGTMRWSLDWTAPSSLPGALRIEIWANAGNDDLSPLGDRLHHRVLSLPASD